jgi:hypothetical protein
VDTTTQPLPGFAWQSAGDSGKTLLIGPNGPVVILNSYNYAMALNQTSLLIWHQEAGDGIFPGPVRLLIIRPALLQTLENLDSNLEAMNRTGPGPKVIMGGDPCAEIRLATVGTDDGRRMVFPDQFQSIDELLILCHAGSNQLALLVANPKRSFYRLYPQDWFNHSDVDFGYQWVTRVARDPVTNRVHGDGIRISPFTLDDSLRRLRK